MFRSTLALATALVVALPASAQLAATHEDASGALSGRSPHKILRPVAATRDCSARMHLPAGKLPTYGSLAFDPACRQTQVASTEAPAKTAKD